MDVDRPSDLEINENFNTLHVIGRGAFATVYLCRVKDERNFLFATKFINKKEAEKRGGLTRTDLLKEICLHKLVRNHRHIVNFNDYNENETWLWIKMQAAQGGDLFDKIEPDVGISEEIAQMYFMQLLSAVEYLHGQGVAHRDIKPENILLSGGGNLLLSDFGFAALFKHKGKTRQSTTICGSPPYVAPEILKRRPYAPDKSDLWSCGILLFVLLTGCTPWEAPLNDDIDFHEFKKLNGRSTSYPWNRLSPDVRSLLREMLRLDPSKRREIHDLRKHPWAYRTNRYMDRRGQCIDPLFLAQKLMVNMHIDLNLEKVKVKEDTRPIEQRFVSLSQFDHGTDLVLNDANLRFASQGGEYVTRDIVESPRKRAPVTSTPGGTEISLLQFSQTKWSRIPTILAQGATTFADICPPDTINRFFAIPKLEPAMRRVLVELRNLRATTPDIDSLPAHSKEANSLAVLMQVNDRRKMKMSGYVTFRERLDLQGLTEIEFSKIKGDPLEWRAFFKRAALACKDILYTEEVE
ncbi:kinase-like domain-containing protein [Lipomyces japonicus]|uniref:kinase-like domain-containing protein n=1 Tax=Lipomyces japonicus TaxID=56871 RepID=UPI0034CD34DE